MRISPNSLFFINVPWSDCSAITPESPIDITNTYSLGEPTEKETKKGDHPKVLLHTLEVPCPAKHGGVR